MCILCQTEHAMCVERGRAKRVVKRSCQQAQLKWWDGCVLFASDWYRPVYVKLTAAIKSKSLLVHATRSVHHTINSTAFTHCSCFATFTSHPLHTKENKESKQPWRVAAQLLARHAVVDQRSRLHPAPRSRQVRANRLGLSKSDQQALTKRAPNYHCVAVVQIATMVQQPLQRW